MDLEREFDRRIAAIHELDSTARDGSNIEGRTMDTRHEEFQAMSSVFLGDDFDAGKLWLVESLQTALHDRQAELYRHLEAQELDPEQYVESFNGLLEDTFAACETILGTENFLKLFGAPRTELAGFIDRETFLQAHQRDEINEHAIERITAVLEENRTYVGTVKRISDSCYFVEIMPGTEGLLHISDFSTHRVGDVRDELTEGQQVLVKVIQVYPSGEIRLSRNIAI